MGLATSWRPIDSNHLIFKGSILCCYKLKNIFIARDLFEKKRSYFHIVGELSVINTTTFILQSSVAKLLVCMISEKFKSSLII